MPCISPWMTQDSPQDSQKVCLKDKADTGKDKIQSPHESKARYSEKRGKSWVGYRTHITETANEIRTSRYRGMMKTHFHGLMIGTAVNLKRLVKAISLSKSNQKQQLLVA